MLGLWLDGGALRLRHDLPLPVPSAGEARVRVLRAGICGTDLELLRGYYPFRGVPGHELVGRVEEGPREWLGKRVVGEINVACGSCRACRADRRRHCERRTVLGISGRDGAFAEHLVLPVGNLHLVPDEVSTDAATFTEPLAAALRAQEQVGIGPGARVLVVGDGRLGQLVGRTLFLTGCHLEVLGRHEKKLGLLARRGVATRRQAPEDGSFDLVVECSGSPEGFATALRALRPLGTLVLKSTYAGELTLDASRLVVDEVTVIGSRCGPFPPALRLLAEGGLEVEELVEARYPLEEAVAAFGHAARRGALKVLVDVAEGPARG